MKFKEKEAKEVKIVEFKKATENGYEKITELRDFWSEPILIGFTHDTARVLIPETELNYIDEDYYEGKIEIKKGFRRTYFEKRGAGYSSVAGDYYIPSVILPITLKIIDLGEQVKVRRFTGNVSIRYVDSVINVQDYVSEETWAKLSDDDKIYLSNVSTEALRADFIAYMNSHEMTPYNLAVFELSQNYNIFLQKEEKEYVDVPIDRYRNAGIILTIGDKAFEINEYAVQCEINGEKQFGFLVTYDFINDILSKIKNDGYREV